MKKIFLTMITLILSLSLCVIFTSCDNKDDDTKKEEDEITSETPGEEDGDGGSDAPVSATSAKDLIIGLVTTLEQYEPDSDKRYTITNVKEKTDTTVYLISKAKIPNITAKFIKISSDAEMKVEIGAWSYDETRKIYYAPLTAPNISGSEMYRLDTFVDGVQIERVLAVQVEKIQYVDPDGDTKS